MKRFSYLLLAAAVVLPLAACDAGTTNAPADAGADTAATSGGFGGRDEIRIVGSSTVYPFTTKVAEQFGRGTDHKTPIIESTGTGGGFKLFCAGVGVDHPDVTNASRAVKESELEMCRGNGVEEVTEIQVGYDGIVVARQEGGEPLDLSLRELFLALAKEVPDGEGQLQANPHRTWADVDPSLPDVEIEVLGPPPTSGTRDAFVELAMEGGCETFDWIAALKDEDEDRYERICHSIREDGAFVEAGENDNLIVQKLAANPDALGIFGYSFLDQNRDKVEAASIEGVEPTFEKIAAQEYAISRPLFIYVKDAHVGVIPGLAEFVGEFVGDSAVGPDGYLTDAGLIPLPEEEHAEVVEKARALESEAGI